MTQVPPGFALRLSAFYATVFGLVGTHLPFFPVWLRAIEIEPSWIGLIVAVPAVTRFTVLPLVTAAAERRNAIRGAMVLSSFATVIGFTSLGMLSQPLAILVVYAAMACL